MITKYFIQEENKDQGIFINFDPIHQYSFLNAFPKEPKIKDLYNRFKNAPALRIPNFLYALSCSNSSRLKWLPQFIFLLFFLSLN